MDYLPLLNAIAARFGALDGASHTHVGTAGLQNEFEPRGWLIETGTQTDTPYLDQNVAEAFTVIATFYVDEVNDEAEAREVEAWAMKQRASEAFYADQTWGGLVEWSTLTRQAVGESTGVDGGRWIACQLEISTNTVVRYPQA